MIVTWPRRSALGAHPVVGWCHADVTRIRRSLAVVGREGETREEKKKKNGEADESCHLSTDRHTTNRALPRVAPPTAQRPRAPCPRNKYCTETSGASRAQSKAGLQPTQCIRSHGGPCTAAGDRREDERAHLCQLPASLQLGKGAANHFVVAERRPRPERGSRRRPHPHVWPQPVRYPPKEQCLR